MYKILKEVSEITLTKYTDDDVLDALEHLLVEYRHLEEEKKEIEDKFIEYVNNVDKEWRGEYEYGE